MSGQAPVTPVNPVTHPGMYSEKNIVVALLLSFFLGYFGIHRFYTGKIGTGVLMIFTFGGLGIWYLIDLVLIAVGEFSDKEGKKLKWSSLQSKSW